MSVWDLLSCRACLVTDVKLFDLHQIGLAEIFGYLCKTPVAPSDGLSQYVCFYCRSQLCKFKDFQYKCQQNYVYLKENAHDLDHIGFHIPLTKTKSLILDYVPENIIADDHNINYDYKVDSHNNNFNYTKNLDDDDGEYNDLIIDFSDDDKKIDDEKPISHDNYNDIDVESNLTIEINVKSEIVDENDIPLKELKIEKDITDINKAQDVLSIKQRKKRKTDIKEKTLVKKVKKKKCNKYNEKFEKDFEEFSKIHNVKVVCLSKDEQIRRVQERKDSKEYRDSRFSCNVCYKGFMSETAHKRHMKSHDPSSGSFVCEVCHMRYPTQRNLKTHARQHKKIFVCALCDQVNVDTTRAKLHSRWHKGVKFPCKICHKEFNANTTYLSHVREVHKPTTCPDCGQTLLGTNALHKHTHAHHKHTQNECDKCSVVFQSSEALDRHRSDNQCGVNSLRLRPCTLCGENFSCRGSLSEHMKQQHSGKGDTFTCELCDSVFTSERSLGAHFAAAHYALKPRARRPADNKLYLCEWCAKGFPTALRLKLHHQFHSDERPYKCSICPKLLKTKAGLEFHMNTHTGQRPYKCRVCPETFKSHAHRHNHQIMKHTTRERRHKCSSCDKSFVTASDLRKHVRYVHLRHPRPHNKPPRNKPTVGSEG